MQNKALGAFYYGYMFTQIPGGILARYTGPKVIIFALIVASGVLNLLSPVSAYADYWLFFTNRFLLGFVQGPCFACMQQMVATWAPPLERSILCAITYTGKHSFVAWSPNRMPRLAVRRGAFDAGLGLPLFLPHLGLDLLYLRRRCPALVDPMVLLCRKQARSTEVHIRRGEGLHRGSRRGRAEQETGKWTSSDRHLLF